jgi:Fe-Mn family superoxide dismutase
MTFELPELPFARDALAPHISAETLDFHYGKHHKAYVDKLNTLVPGTEFAGMSLEDIIKKSSGGIFNNAAQIWNHTFYWHSMSPNGGGEPSGDLLTAIEKSFGTVAEFKSQFTQAAIGQFGSGWAWLVKKADGSLAITTTANAETPLTGDDTPLFTCDVWEHAYYIDTRNARPKYLENFWQVINWEFAASNL